jgi:two-component sensor histidine kinase
LTREVHRRVKNNLQIVTSLLTMQAARMEDAGAQAALKQARARIVALALIHRLTYEQESVGSQSRVTVETLIAELTKQLRYAHRDRRTIDLSYEADAYAMPVDTAVPFALFIVEAVTNSFRHAFPDDADGEIALSFALDNGHARLVIQDNGQGYETDNPVLGQMGTELMEGFASQLNGNVTFSSDRQNGSATTLHFPTVLDSSEQNTRPLPA